MAVSPISSGLSSASNKELTESDTFEPPPSAVPAGFDSIVQISTPLMHRTLAANLAAGNLNPLSARVPYQAELVSSGLQAMIQPLLKPIQVIEASEAPPQLEVQILDPFPQALSWPLPPDLGVVGPSATTTAVRASPAFGRKMVDLVWSVQVNLFTPQIAIVATAGNGPSNSPVTQPGRSGLVAGIGTLSATEAQTVVVAPPLPRGSRTTLVQGTATMHVPSELTVNTQLYQARLVLNFEGVQPTYTSQDPVMLEFLQTDLAASLLAQAVAPLLNQYAMGLSPTIAFAGNLTPSQITQAMLPALHVNDMVVSDNKGQLVVFCVSLGTDSHGAFSMVTSFLAGHDFAYFASDKIFAPVLKGLWRANAILTPIVSDLAVEMPVSQDSNETGVGRVRVQVNLNNTLDDAAVVPSISPSLGDPMRIVSQQTVSLLSLWDPQGNQVTDLGDFGKPAVVPLTLSLQMYDKLPGGPQHSIAQPLGGLLNTIFMPLYFPTVERYGVTTVSGFSSSPLRSIVSRWSLPKTTIGPIALPTGGTLTAA